MKILGIETSCDETAVAVIDIQNKGKNYKSTILSNVVYTQLGEHKDYGGVVPEIASRTHLERLDSLVSQALEEASLTLNEIECFAATAGPGLLGGLIVGLTYAKSLAFSTGKPLVGVNHLEGHALVAGLSEEITFPYLLLLVSGGHCQFIHITKMGGYTTIGGTIDDSIGEAFDKTAKLLGLEYPGGPAIEKLAKEGDSTKISLPLPLQHKGINFSFSGLKTAVRTFVDKNNGDFTKISKADIAASFQESVARILEIKTDRALVQCGTKYFVLAGGVAANKLLRNRLEATCNKNAVTFCAPPVNLCTDNAVMIAYAGGLRLLHGEKSPLNIKPMPRWPLEDVNLVDSI